MKNVHLFLLCFFLVVTGLSLFFYKYTYLDFPLTPDSIVEVWNVETKISFEVEKKPVKVRLNIPKNTKLYTISSESFISGSFGLVTDIKKENRRSIWSIRKTSGVKTLYYRAVIQKRGKLRKETLSEGEINNHKFDDAQLLASRNIITSAFAKSADMDTMVSELFRKFNTEETDENVLLLLGKEATPEQKVKMAVRILAVAKIPARIVYGIELKEQRGLKQLRPWLEVYYNKVWRSYSPKTGLPDIPENYLSWYKGGYPLVKAKGVKKLRYTISVSPNQEEAIKKAVERGKIQSPNFLKFLSLFGLSIQTQSLYRIILLIPVGVFLVVFLRNVIGLKTFGTFMPVLISLSFRETQLFWGIFWFLTLIGFGVLFRFYLENLKLLLVPRLASVLIVVVLLMVMLNVFTQNLGLELGLSIALFPMVILTMTIERVSIVWEERGAKEALQQGLGTLVVAIISYLIITNQLVGHVVFVFPEVLLVLLSFTILLGRYTGYRLSEIGRFQSLVATKEDDTK